MVFFSFLKHSLSCLFRSPWSSLGTVVNISRKLAKVAISDFVCFDRESESLKSIEAKIKNLRIGLSNIKMANPVFAAYMKNHHDLFGNLAVFLSQSRFGFFRSVAASFAVTRLIHFIGEEIGKAIRIIQEQMIKDAERYLQSIHSAQKANEEEKIDSIINELILTDDSSNALSKKAINRFMGLNFVRWLFANPINEIERIACAWGEEDLHREDALAQVSCFTLPQGPPADLFNQLSKHRAEISMEVSLMRAAQILSEDKKRLKIPEGITEYLNQSARAVPKRISGLIQGSSTADESGSSTHNTHQENAGSSSSFNPQQDPIDKGLREETIVSPAQSSQPCR